MKVLVVDDEPIARRRLVRMLGRIRDAEVVGEAADGEEALEQLRSLEPDVLLLDIRMPALDGLSLALGEQRLPAIVFVTAHAEYAVDAFGADAVDYVLKPVEQARLEEALERVRKRRTVDPRVLEELAKQLAAGARPPRLAAQRGDSRYFFDALEIDRLRARDKYTSFNAEGRTYLLEEGLTSLAARLGEWGFLRVHRSELVNLRFVRALHRTGRGVVLELASGERVPVSRRRVAAVVRLLGSA